MPGLYQTPAKGRKAIPHLPGRPAAIHPAAGHSACTTNLQDLVFLESFSSTLWASKNTFG
jgi:hypothetical protein